MNYAATVGRYTARFWAALDNGEFLFHRYGDCERAFFPQRRSVYTAAQPMSLGRLPTDGNVLFIYPSACCAIQVRIERRPRDRRTREGTRVLVPVKAAYDDLIIEQTVELVTVEYEVRFARGDLDGRPYFATRLQ